MPLREVQAHTDPRSKVEPASPLCLPDGTELGADLAVTQDAEPKVLVERPVPCHVGVGGEGDGVAVGLQSPRPYSVDECTTRPQALVVRVHAHLVDVSVAVEIGNDHVADWLTGHAEHNPASTIPHVALEFVDRWRRIVCHLRQPDLAEPLSSKPLDLLEQTGVKILGGAD